MAYTVIVVLLVDTVTELTGDLDKNMEDIKASFSSEEYKCKSTLVDSIIDIANRELSMDLIPPVKHEARETLNSNYENSITDLNITPNEFIDYKCQEDLKKVKHNAINFALAETSFLVAIFETLSNTTAHTCAGTLLSPNWVLTSASCIDVLAYLGNRTSTERSVYTIVVGAVNPMIDGSAHNVTQVLFHHDLHIRMADNSSKSSENRNSGLAMLRIDPAAAVTGLNILIDKTPFNVEAHAYGWIYKNESNVDAMRSISITVKIESKIMCDLKNITLEEDLCMTVGDSDSNNTSKPSWGGGVVAVIGRQARVLGVTHAGQQTVTATNVYGHAAWIQAVLTDNVV